MRDHKLQKPEETIGATNMNSTATANHPPAQWAPHLGSTTESTQSSRSMHTKQTTTEDVATFLGVNDPATWSDHQLMLAVAEGRADALEVLYDRHMRGCFGLAMKIVRDPAVAEEVVQDIFVKLWSQPTIFSPERGKFSGWLLTLVHNRSVDKLRRAHSGLASVTSPLDLEGENGISLADVLPDTGPTPDDTAWLHEKGEIVREALRKLPEAQRTAISLAYFGGLTQKEIAERLQEPLGTIKTRTRSGLQQLRRLLTHDGLVGDLR
jgi:RNA polymerase sigma-70 factor, ECF subfamily